MARVIDGREWMEKPLRNNTHKELSPGSNKLLGATPLKGGVNFSLYSAHAEQVFLLLFDSPDTNPTDIIELKRSTETDIWHILVRDVNPGQLYGYKVTGPYDPSKGLRFNPHKLLMDPYARAMTGKFRDRDGLLYGYDRYASDGDRCSDKDLCMDIRDNTLAVPKCIVMDSSFDWGDDTGPAIAPSEMIIYEAHLKGFTAHPSSGVTHPGTYLGFVEKIPYLRDLGVTSIELLPVQEFHIRDELVRKGLTEYWGYNTIGFFAPESSYAAGSSPGSQVQEFKTLVRELHRAGMEVILDVVYNHTGEENELGPTLCFRGIDNPSYYALEGPADHPGRFYRDATGCRNTLDIEKPAVLRLVMDSLRYWVQEMHVDGFRFDLATVLGYREGAFTSEGDFFDALGEDPVLSGVKLIAEPWDITARKTGRFPAGWMEWNDSYRDTVRKYLRGDRGQVGGFATRFGGSQDIFGKGGRAACSSINYITAHDGFSLYDLYSFEQKHNEANGEDNRDGTDNNNSFNCGVEGATDDTEVLELRRRMVRKGLCVLLMSRGVPMLLSGDEVMRTQRGNNNAYCQDNETSWFPWDLTEQNRDMLDFCRGLIGLRKEFSVFRQCSFFSGERAEGYHPDISWYGSDLNPPNWEDTDMRLLCCELNLTEKDGSLHNDNSSLFMIFNMDAQQMDVRLPKRAGVTWYLVCDTGLKSAHLFSLDGGTESIIPENHYHAGERTVVILLGMRD